MGPGNGVTQAVWRTFGTSEGDTACRLTNVLVVLRAGAALSVGSSEGLLGLHLFEGGQPYLLRLAEDVNDISKLLEKRA